MKCIVNIVNILMEYVLVYSVVRKLPKKIVINIIHVPGVNNYYNAENHVFN